MVLAEQPLAAFLTNPLPEIADPAEAESITNAFCTLFTAIEPFTKLNALLRAIDRLAICYPLMSADDLIPLMHFFIVSALTRLDAERLVCGIYAHCVFIDDCLYKSGSHALQILTFGKEACCLTHFQVAMGLMVTPSGRAAMLNAPLAPLRS